MTTGRPEASVHRMDAKLDTHRSSPAVQQLEALNPARCGRIGNRHDMRRKRRGRGKPWTLCVGRCGVDGRALVLNKSNDMRRLRGQSWDGGSGFSCRARLLCCRGSSRSRSRPRPGGGITSSFDDVLAWRSSQGRGKSGENTVVAFARAGKLTRHPDCSEAKGMERREGAWMRKRRGPHVVVPP